METVEWELASPSNSIYSVGTYTGAWMERTFINHGEDSVYVTAAPFSDLILDSNEFAKLDEVWRYAFDEEVGTIPPRAVTDRAIKYSRQKRESQRLVVHYMQPHFPSLAHPELGSELQPDTDGWPASIWTRLENGEITEETVWEAYRSNLEFVIDEVELILTQKSSHNL